MGRRPPPSPRPRCPDCLCPFVSEYWLDRHREKPHTQCPDCPRAFINLAAHRRRTHDLTDEGRQEIGYKIAQGMARRAEKDPPVTLYSISFRITDKGDPALAGEKLFSLDLPLDEADDLRDRLLRLQTGRLIEDLDMEPDRITGQAAPVHELLDLFDPETRRTS